MPGFDSFGGPSLFDGVVGGTPNFDILAPNPGGLLMPGQGQNGALPNGVQPGGQPQGAPVSGSVAGLLGLPTSGGALPGAAYLTPGQLSQSVGQTEQLNQLLRMGGLPTGAPAGAGQPQNNVGSAVGSGLRSLFDGVVGLGR